MGLGVGVRGRVGVRATGRVRLGVEAALLLCLVVEVPDERRGGTHLHRMAHRMALVRGVGAWRGCVAWCVFRGGRRPSRWPRYLQLWLYSLQWHLGEL